jgi:serine/threonine-protein kinase
VETTREHIAAGLSDQYLVERKLGEGGMATVFLAHDIRHDRKVAIKVLRPELASAIGAERFLTEIRVMAQLSHPRILALIDSGKAASPDGGEMLYYVMPFVDGESLRTRLDRDKQLSLDDALDITQQVADALAYAHAHGVIHRDIKPENILLEHGHARVADFGVARALRTAGDARITETGIAIGTPTYMSPEQSTAERELDARSDVYSLASVTYEMLVGEPPFVAPNAQALIARRLTETPRPVRATRDGVPPGVDTAIMRALARAPADRFVSIEQFGAALKAAATEPAPPARRRSVAVGAAIVTGIVLLSVFIFGPPAMRGRSSVGTAASPPRIAVLPFENLGRTDDEAFAAGVTEEITSRLTEISALRVVSRTSARRFAGSDASMSDVGQALNADFVLEGAVRTDHVAGGAGMARVTPRLVRVSDDVQVWKQVFDVAMVPGEILRVQADIASQVAAAMNVTLLADERGRVARAVTSDTAAYRLYQFGRFQWEKRTPESLTLAKEYFRQAIERDPSFARAYAGLGDATFVLAFTQRPDSALDESMQAIAALRRAVALDSTLAEGYAGLGYAITFANWDWISADSTFRRAIALDPTYAPAHYWYMQLLAVTGSIDSALVRGREAVGLDPLSAVANFSLGVVALRAGRFDEGLAALERAAELQPTYRFSYWPLAIEYARRGEHDKAEAALRRNLTQALDGRAVDPGLIRDVVGAFARNRDTTSSIERLLATGAVRGHGAAAWAFAAAGKRDSAFARLDKALAMRSAQLVVGLGNTARLLETDPRWGALERRVGLRR